MKKLKKRLYKILLAFVVFLFANFLPIEIMFEVSEEMQDTIRLCIYLVAYMIAGGDVVKTAAQNIVNGQIFDENFLMTIATVGAFLVSEYPEAVAVMLFYQVGELFQSYAVNKSRASIAELMDIRPDYANLKDQDEIRQVSPEEVPVGAMILIKPGERIPLDGIVKSGESSLDVSALTGESLLREVAPEDSVISGSINKEGVLEVQVTKEFGDSTVSRILDLVENATDKKAETENFVTRFAKYYTPIVCILAVLIAIVPPLLIGMLTGTVEQGSDGTTVTFLAGVLGSEKSLWGEWIYRALSFLVISCPCALVISVPLSFFGGLGGASAKGILVKGSNYLEALGNCKTVVFDKTGTLTKGVFQVQDIEIFSGTREALLTYAAIGEGYSGHPIGNSVKDYYYSEMKTNSNALEKLLKDATITEEAGYGTITAYADKKIVVGNAKLMEKANIKYKTCEITGTHVYVAVDGICLGCLVIADALKETTKEAIVTLKKLGIEKTVLLTGDRTDIAKQIGESLGIDEIYAELLPADKVTQLEVLLTQKKKDMKVAYVGDGINDAPVLARADIGIAMGALGSDAAIEAADIVLMDDNPAGIGTAIRIARKTVQIVKQNIVFAIGIKVLVLILAALGFANMWAAVFADVGVAVLAILNALRALKI